MNDMTNSLDAFIKCRCVACTRLDHATSATFPDSDNPELRACWEEIEKTCPHYGAAFGGVCAAVRDDTQLDMFGGQS